MKTPSLKLLSAVLLGILVSACGQIESAKRAPGENGLETSSGQLLSLTDFHSECAERNGIVDSNNICMFTVNANDLGSATSPGFSEVSLGAVQPGYKIIAEGSSQTSSVEFYLNGSRVGRVPMTARINAPGELMLRLSPGSYSNVRFWVVGCLNQSLSPVSCP